MLPCSKRVANEKNMKQKVLRICSLASIRRQVSMVASSSSNCLLSSRSQATQRAYSSSSLAMPWATPNFGSRHDIFHLKKRYYSYDNASSIEEMELEPMRRRTRALLQVPVGDFDPDTWFEADDLIKWWSFQQNFESVETSFKLLDRMMEELRFLPREELTEDLLAFFDARVVVPTMLSAWFEVWKEEVAKGTEKKLSLTPEKILECMDGYAAEIPGENPFRLPGKILSYLFEATSLSPEPYAESAPFCDYLIDRLVEVMPKYSNVWVYHINRALDLWAKSDRSDKVQRAEMLFTRASDLKVDMDLITYNTLLSVYANAGLGKKAERLLEALVDDHLRGTEQGRENAAPAPDEVTFHTVALAYAKSNEGLAAGQRADFLVQRLLDPLDDYGRLGVEVTSTLFNTVILAYSRSGVPEAGAHAHRVLTEMKKTNLAAPDDVSFGTVIDAYSRCNQPEMAEKVLDEQLASFLETGDENQRPNTLTMTMLVLAYSKSSHPQKKEKSTELLKRIMDLRSQGILVDKPDTYLYNTVLGCLMSQGKTRETAVEAEAFVMSMKTRAEAGDKSARPNSWTYSELILLFLEIGDLEKAEKYVREATADPLVDLDIRTTARFIYAVAKRGWVQRADYWLHFLLDRCQEAGSDRRRQPSTSLLGAVAHAWKKVSGKVPDAGERIQVLVDRYEKSVHEGNSSERPDALVYSTLINCLVRSKNTRNKSSRVLGILERMRMSALRNPALTNRMMPKVAAYRDVLRALVEEGKIKNASDLVLQMIDDYQFNPKVFPAPDSNCVLCVLEGWLAAPPNSSSWENALAIFQRIEDANGDTDRELANLQIRDNRAYAKMIELAKKLSLKQEAEVLSKALQAKLSTATERPQSQRRKSWSRRK